MEKDINEQTISDNHINNSNLDIRNISDNN